MLIFREQRATFLGLIITQFFFTLVTLALEFGQYSAYVNLTPDSPDFLGANWFVNVDVKIWNIAVSSLTLIIHTAYLYHFKKIWNKGPYLSLDLFLAVLWLTACVANLYPVYGTLHPDGNHPIQACSVTITFALTSICSTWVASMMFCWSNMFSLIMSAIISWRVRQEKLQGIYFKPRVKPEIRKRMSQRQSVLLKKCLENPDQSQPVMLESGVKPLMLVQLSNTS